MSITESYLSEDNLVTKFIHDDTSETSIKQVSSCDTVFDPATGTLEYNNVDRRKYSVFASISAGCYMNCEFCYLTMKGMKFKKLNRDKILQNLKDAVIAQWETNPPEDRYIKLCWMGMGDAGVQPYEDDVYEITLDFLDWAINNGYAKGIDGVDLATVLPNVKRWGYEVFQALNDALHDGYYDKINPNNDIVVHKEQGSRFPDHYPNRSLFRLFYSLHSAVPETREEIMPKCMPIERAIEQLLEYSQNNKYNLIFHHMFMHNINDSEHELQALTDLIDKYKLHNYEMRILRYNQCEGDCIRESDYFDQCVNHLAKTHSNMKVQISTGTEIQSACGQFVVKQYQ